MGQPAQHAVHTVEEYLDLEGRSQGTKHEYWQGDIIAMTGGTLRHAGLCATLIMALGRHLKGKPCRVYSSDARVRVYASLGKPSDQDILTYPDVSVACGQVPADPQDPGSLVNPVVLVEVLSASTQKYDRGVKLELYKTIPSLHHVVLAAYDKTLLEVVSRDAAAKWDTLYYGPGEHAALSKLGIALDVDDIYQST